MTILLIDGDIVAYQSASATEVAVAWDDDLWTVHGYATETNAHADQTISRLMEKADCSQCIVLLSGRNNFRKDIDPEYKANRVGKRKPVTLSAVRKHLQSSYKSMVGDPVEADDLLGILLTKNPEKYVLWSIDKDLRQIAGRHLIDDGVVTITQEQADRAFWIQVLTGDAADNYKGISGVGPKTAEKILDADDGKSSWEKVKAAYEKAGMTEDDAIKTARLAHILTNQTKNELWSPPSET
jgi:DNA polymerase-1